MLTKDKPMKEASGQVTGRFGERVARKYFEAMGFCVDQLGIENVVPNYLSLKAGTNHGPGLSVGFRFLLTRLPDLLISWRYDAKHPRWANKHDAIFVDAKVRGNHDEFPSDTLYDVYLALGATVMIFEICLAKNDDVDGSTDVPKYSALHLDKAQLYVQMLRTCVSDGKKLPVKWHCAIGGSLKKFDIFADILANQQDAVLFSRCLEDEFPTYLKEHKMFAAKPKVT